MDNNQLPTSKKYIKSALFQSISTKLAQYDNEFINNGGKIIYAIDTNIVNLFCNPYGGSQSKKTIRHNGVGEIFPHPDKEKVDDVSFLIARELAYYLFKNLTEVAKPKIDDTPISKKPFMTFALTGNEIASYLKSLIYNIDNQDKYKKNNKTKKISDLSKQTVGKLDLKSLKKIMNQLTQLNDKINEFNRFKEIIKTNQSVLSGAVLYHKFSENIGISGNEKIQNALAETNNIFDLVKQASFKEEWIENLLKIYNKKKPTRRDLKNSELLSKIQFINNVIDKETEGKCRLVFITNADSIYEAAKRYELGSVDLPYLTFADKYIRTPQQYVGNMIEFNNKYLNDVDTFEDWLDRFLAKIDINESGSVKKLREGINKIEEEKDDNLGTSKGTDFIKKIHEEWQDFIRLHNIGNMDDDKIYRVKGQSLPKYPVLNNAGELRKKIIKLLEDSKIKPKVKNAWLDFEIIGLQAGYFNYNDLAPEKRLSRFPPPVFILGFEKIQKLLNEFISGKKGHSLDDFIEIEETISEECTPKTRIQKKTQRYIRLLFYTALYTVSKNEKIALKLAEKAYSIKRSTKNKVSCREICFMLAYIHRIFAKSIDALNASYEKLHESYEIYEKTRGKDKLGYTTPERNLLELRHKAELLSLSLEVHFRKCLSEKVDKGCINKDYTVFELSRCIEEAEKILNITREHNDDEIRKHIYREVILSACCDYYSTQLAIVYEKELNIDYFDTDKNKEIFKLFKKYANFQKNDNVFLSYIMKVMYGFAEFISTKKITPKLKKLLSKNERKKHRHTEFDRKRFLLINNLVNGYDLKKGF